MENRQQPVSLDYETLFVHSPVPQVLVTTDGDVRQVSRGFCELVGRSSQDMLHTSLLDLAGPADREALGSWLAAEDSPDNPLLVFLNAASQPVRIRLEMAPLPTSDAVLLAAHELPPESLLDAHLRYQMMYESNPTPMWVFDAETYAFLDVNEAAVQVYGYSREEFLGMTILDIRPADEVELLLQRLTTMTDNRRTGRIWCHRKKDGDLLYADVTSHAIEYNGRPARVALIRDISEQHLIEQERARHLLRLQQLANISLRVSVTRPLPEVLQIITEEARELIGAHQSVTSLVRDDKWGQAISAISLSDKYAQWRDYDELPDGSGIYSLVCQTNQPMRMTQEELEAHPRWRAFGEHAADHPPMRGWLAVPLISRTGENLGLIQLSDKYEGEFTPDDEYILVQLAQLASVSIDNSRLYDQVQRHAGELEQRVEERTRELQEANNRLRELDALKNKFISEVSHELRNPITQMNLKVDLMKRAGPEHLERHLAGLERQVRQLLRLTNQVLDLSRLEMARDRLVFEDVDLNALVQQVADLYREEVEAQGLGLQMQLDPFLPPVWGADSQLAQVVANLLSNAVKYTPSGQVTLRTSFMPASQQICLEVEDTGIGIGDDEIPHLFERFYRSEQVMQSSIPGTGLGLGIVSEIAELHGGSVAVHSQPGEGSVFQVCFPVRQVSVM